MNVKYSEYEKVPLRDVDSVVLLVKNNIKVYVMKKFRYQELYLNELKILQILKEHGIKQVPQIIDHYEIKPTVVCPSNDNTYDNTCDNTCAVIIYDYINGCDLFDYIDRRLPESELNNIAIQMIKLLNKMHLLGIIHRDIKLENFIIDDKNVIHLIDFGLSCLMSDKYVKTAIIPGSACYVSREYVKLHVNLNYGYRVGQHKINQILLSNDIFSMTIALYVLYNGDYPYKDNIRLNTDDFRLITKILDDEDYIEVFTLSKKISNEHILNIIDLSLENDYESRISLWNSFTSNLE